MTDVSFHFNVPERNAYACRLLRKAVAGGARVWVHVPRDQVEALDSLLWSFSALDFVPHCKASAPEAVLRRSAVVLGSDGDTYGGDRPVLINLSDEIPSGFEQHDRLIEVVSREPAEREAARMRWRHYGQRGYKVSSHDASAGRD